LTHLGVVAYGEGDPERAVALLADALVAHRTRGDAIGVGLALGYLALLATERRDLGTAAKLQRESLSTAGPLGATEELAQAMANSAVLAAAAAQPERSVRLFGATAKLRETLGTTPKLPEARLYDRALAAARAALDAAAFAAAWDEGRSLPLTRAIAEAADAGVTADAGSRRGHGAKPDALTAREVDVLRLLAVGRTNAEIAEALFIRPGTARIHVSNILAKLGAKTRTEAADVARQRNLL
jgi:DNA-binding CsgD family transcriptional regulator